MNCSASKPTGNRHANCASTVSCICSFVAVMKRRRLGLRTGLMLTREAAHIAYCPEWRGFLGVHGLSGYLLMASATRANVAVSNVLATREALRLSASLARSSTYSCISQLRSLRAVMNASADETSPSGSARSSISTTGRGDSSTRSNRPAAACPTACPVTGQSGPRRPRPVQPGYRRCQGWPAVRWSSVLKTAAR